MQLDPPGVRAPAVAGQFYPRDRVELEGLVDRLLRDVDPEPGPAPKAIIAPHAGFIYSGPIAASAYAQWRVLRERITRVVILGPAHRVRFKGLALPNVSAFATPLGPVAVDASAVRILSALRQVRVFDAAHQKEHSIEVQLPFLQRVLAHFDLVPLLIGQAETEEVCEVIESVWGGPETRIVVSSDLSHYYPATTARQMDAATAASIEALEPDDLGDEAACGRLAIRGLMLAARRRGLRARTVDLRNSGDTGGLGSQVVGYGAFVFGEEAPAAG